ncbi:RasGEF domain-containing protein [Gaertneriomyces semiglobifer]|nr:RasGEF domain-containing protein [Gaertneriomyces semiglobifer]
MLVAYEFTRGARQKKEMEALGAGDRWTGRSLLHGVINYTHAVATWIMSSILSEGGDSEKSVRERWDVLRYCRRMAVYCTEIKNYNFLTAISRGLANAAIGRLHRTWAALWEKYTKLHETYE